MEKLNHPLTELFLRNHDLLANENVVFAGDIDSMQVLNLAKGCNKATFIIDNYAVAKQCAAALGQNLGTSFNEKVSVGFISIIFAPLELAAKEIKEVSRLVVFLSKAKKYTATLLRELQSQLTPNAQILIAGSNDSGGKSADSLLKECGNPYKVDSARKCTLFAVNYEKAFSRIPTPKAISYKDLTLNQSAGVFSQGKVDEGTALLLEKIPEDIAGLNALDLGCGCGILGLTLAKHGAHVTFIDISAQALYLASQNAQVNKVEGNCTFTASFMLDNATSYDLIVTNPPFHEGIKKAEGATLHMISMAPNHLNQNGALYLVGNSFLNYDLPLQDAFKQVETLAKTTRFAVFKAS